MSIYFFCKDLDFRISLGVYDLNLALFFSFDIQFQMFALSQAYLFSNMLSSLSLEPLMSLTS